MVDPATQLLTAVATNLFSSAIWDLLRDPAFGTGLQESPARRYAAAIDEAVERLEPALAKVPSEDEVAARAFLESAEVRALVASLFRTRIADPHHSLVDLRQAFVATWGSRWPAHLRALPAYDVFDAIAFGCERILEESVRRGDLGAHESLSARRHHETNGRLRAIERQLRSMTAANGAPDATRLDRLEKKLRRTFEASYGHISPPSTRGQRDVPLDDIYVAPRFTAGPELTLRLDDIAAQTHRLVVLGRPGAGKSTFARRVCQLAARSDLQLSGGGAVVVAFLELRAYARATDRNPMSLRTWLETHLKTQFSIEPPPGAIDHLLASGRLGVVFDGLDELPVVARRREMRNAIQGFAQEFPLTPIIVTSRLIGYEHASLDNTFQEARLADFDDAQIEDYARRWFKLQARKEPGSAANAETFLHESRVAPDLRVNPLMLGLMCVLYRGQGYIPRNRPDLYRQCATYLFETWDRHRGIETIAQVETLLRPALRHLAHWVYATPALSDGVPYESAVRRTAEFLTELRFSDPIRAEAAARDFIDFCRGRAWVFSDVGADADDQDLFQFTHRTFLEFFTAEQLLNDNETVAQLVRAVRPRILAGEWEVVAELAVHIKETQRTGSADEIVSAILGSATKGVRHRRAVGFAVRMIRNLPLAPATVRATADIALRMLAAADLAVRRSRSRALAAHAEADEIAGLLLGCELSNREIVEEAMHDHVAQLLADGQPEVRSHGIEWLAYGRLAGQRWLRHGIEEQRTWLFGLFDRIEDRCVGPATELAHHELHIAVDLYRAGVLDIEALTRIGSPETVFVSRRPLLLLSEQMPSVASEMLGLADRQTADRLLNELLRSARPWLSAERLVEHLRACPLRWVADRQGVIFGVQAFVVCAAIEPFLDGTVRSDAAGGMLDLLDSLVVEDIESGDLQRSVIQDLVDARDGRVPIDEIADIVRARAGPATEAAHLLLAWADREVSFVGSA